MQIWDIDTPPPEALGKPFDIVLAANVLHTGNNLAGAHHPFHVRQAMSCASCISGVIMCCSSCSTMCMFGVATRSYQDDLMITTLQRASLCRHPDPTLW